MPTMVMSSPGLNHHQKLLRVWGLTIHIANLVAMLIQLQRRRHLVGAGPHSTSARQQQQIAARLLSRVDRIRCAPNIEASFWNQGDRLRWPLYAGTYVASSEYAPTL